MLGSTGTAATLSLRLVDGCRAGTTLDCVGRVRSALTHLEVRSLRCSRPPCQPRPCATNAVVERVAPATRDDPSFRRPVGGPKPGRDERSRSAKLPVLPLGDRGSTCDTPASPRELGIG